MAHQVLKLLQQKPQQCGAIKTVNLFNKYLILVTFETNCFESKFQIIAQLFNSIRFEMKKNTIRRALQIQHHNVKNHNVNQCQ